MEAIIGKSSQAPDPYQTAAAQTQSNENTANYNAALNRVNVYTPYGNSVYSHTGTGPSGWSNTITLTPEAQQELDNELKQNTQLSTLGNTLAQQAAQQINTPYSDESQSGDAAAQAYYNRQKTFLDPQWNQSQSDLDAKLANQGVAQGSNAYERAQGDLQRARTQAYDTAQNDAIAQGQTQQQIALANQQNLKNAPINQLDALRSGTQITNPTFPTAPQASAAPTDISSDIYNSYQMQQANNNNFLNGLFGLGGAAITAFSDRRLKTNIHAIGKTPILGLPVYTFSYIWSPDRVSVGCMADEVEKVVPAAVINDSSGYKRVNYGLVI